MGLWKAITKCYVQGVLLDGEAIVELTDEQEKAEKLGKYAEAKPDQKALRRDPASKKTISVGNKNLVKVNRSAIAGAEGKPIDDGMVLYPPAKGPIERAASATGDVHATTFQHTR
jgi:hypothetical protein